MPFGHNPLGFKKEHPLEDVGTEFQGLKLRPGNKKFGHFYGPQTIDSKKQKANKKSLEISAGSCSSTQLKKKSYPANCVIYPNFWSDFFLYPNSSQKRKATTSTSHFPPFCPPPPHGSTAHLHLIEPFPRMARAPTCCGTTHHGWGAFCCILMNITKVTNFF